jgi:hypothetical protein
MRDVGTDGPRRAGNQDVNCVNISTGFPVGKWDGWVSAGCASSERQGHGRATQKPQQSTGK